MFYQFLLYLKPPPKMSKTRLLFHPPFLRKINKCYKNEYYYLPTQLKER